LKGKVINALKKAYEPSYYGCKFDINSDSKLILQTPANGEIGEAFRNYPVNYFMILKQEEFKKLSIKFSCKEDPLTKQPLIMHFDHSEFVPFEDATNNDTLFKLSTRAYITENPNIQNLGDLSVTYQVLSSATAFIGVIKQYQKET
jgi:hypothetical protein